MSSVYAKFIAESAYKHTVDKPHTGNGIAFFEEKGRIAHRVDLDAIWTDSEYIPINAPEVDENGFYIVNVGSSKLKILQKLEDIPLDKVEGTLATYRSIYLIDAIFPSYGTGYTVTLTDWNKEIIPFGLNQWVIDPDNGEITFLGGWPEGYLETPRISFYRYVGRKANDTFLRADGSVQMIDEYSPTKDQDIATKKYVDSVTGDVVDVVNKLVPSLPPTLDRANLTLDYENTIYASPWNSEAKLPLVFYGDDYKIQIPQFYNPGYGEFHVNINGFDILDVDLATVTGPEVHDYWVVTSVVDPYRTSKVANNFYKSINSYIKLSDEAVKSLISVDIPYITLYCYTYYNFEKIASNPITIGFDNRMETPYMGTYVLDNMNHESGEVIKYISGVPTLKSGTYFNYSYSLKDVLLYKNDYIGKFTVGNIHENFIEASKTYNTAYPTQFITERVTVPEGAIFESLPISIIGNDVELKDNISTSKVYNFRADTISDESQRKISPTNFDDVYEASDWDDVAAKEPLTKTNELQMLYGLYQWPTGNYTKHGDCTEQKITDDITLPSIPVGPDYSEITSGVRYVTFSYEMPSCNGFWISFDNAVGTLTDKDTHAFSNITQFRCCVENETGWLNMSIPYEGVLSPRATNEGCLVVQSSDENTKYITFGNAPLEGRLDIAIGINRASGIKFSGLKIVFNV